MSAFAGLLSATIQGRKSGKADLFTGNRCQLRGGKFVLNKLDRRRANSEHGFRPGL